MRIFYTHLLVLFAFVSNGQISEPGAASYTLIGKVMADKLVKHKLEKGVRGDTGFYRLTIGLIDFKNTGEKYREKFYNYVPLTFLETGGVLDKLYEICKTVFSDENRNDQSYTRNIKLGSYDVEIKTDKMLKKPAALLTFWLNETYGSVNLLVTEKELDKLFGR